MIVVDASALTDLLVGRSAALDAIGESVAPEPNASLHAPELVEPETLNTLRGLVRAGQLTEERAGGAVADLDELRLVRYPHAPLRERVWELRHELCSHDASYLAPAEALPDPLLVTGDRALASRAAGSLGAAAVRRI